MDLVQISWRDAASCSGWHSPDDVEFGDDFLTCHSVGVVVQRDDRIVVLAQTWGDDEKHDVGGLWCIPTKMILSEKVLIADVRSDV